MGKASTKVRFFEQNGKVKCYIEGAYCFTQGTPILLANDQLKPIEQIAVGDTVATYNHELKRRSFGVVKRLFKRSTKKLTRLAIAGSLLFATPSHKIYADGEYQPASSVTTDSELLAANGKKLQIQSEETIDSTASVYNFEVKGDHNYFAGANGVLVHNSCGWKTIRERLADAGKESRFKAFHQSIISSGLTSAQRKKLYDKIAELGDKAEDFIDDFAENVDALKKFASDDKLVDSWKAARNLSDDIRRNTDDLEIISDYMNRSGKSADDIAGEIPTFATDSKKWLGERKIEPFLDGSPNISSITSPPGYEIYQVQGRKYIRRFDAADPYTPRLMVDENGTVVKYTKPVRSNNQPAFINNLKAVYGDMPLNHQRHHLVSVNVVDNSVIHQEAIRRASYSVDRASNGRYLAETAADFSQDASGLSRNYPTHFGSHPKYDAELNKVINEYTNALKNKYDSIDKVPEDVLKQAVTTIENRAESILKGWQPSKLN